MIYEDGFLLEISFFYERKLNKFKLLTELILRYYEVLTVSFQYLLPGKK